MSELHVAFGTGPVGLAVVSGLLARGKHVRVASRSGARRGLPETIEVLRGDATNPEDTRRVCAGASHVYNCTNAPDYHRWPEQFPPLQRGVLAGKATAGAKLIVMENLYMYGPRWRDTDARSDAAPGPRIAQHDPPHADRGIIRGAPRGTGACHQRARVGPDRSARHRVAGG